MAWANSNWISFTGANRLTALRSHIQEVSDAITAGISADGTSYNPINLQTLLEVLLRKEAELSEQLVGGVFAVPTRRRY